MSQTVVSSPSTQDRTLLTVWQLLSEQYADQIALRDPHSEPILELNYGDLFGQIKAFAAGLQSLGVKPGDPETNTYGDRVALFADNSPRWLIADLGSMFAGAVNVPRSSSADPQELDFILRDSGSTTVVVEHVKVFQRIQSSLTDLGIVRVIVLSDATQPGCLTFQEVLAKGRSHGYTAPPLKRSQLATIIYTSGTSGRPKGVMLSHGNFMHQVENAEAVFEPKPGNKALTILPTWHSYERSAEYYLFSRAITMIYTDARHIKHDLQKEEPHYLTAVPRIWETVYEGVQRQFKAKSRLLQIVIQSLLHISERYILMQRIATNRSLHHFQASPLERSLAKLAQILLLPLHKLGDQLVYRQVRAAVGPNFTHAVSGGGSLPAYLDLFFEIVGVSILNGYGLTETSPILACRRPEHNVRGTVGPALPHTAFKIVDPETREPLPDGQKGLILARGPQVMLGYYNNPEATAKVLSSEGWFNTGDLGWITPAQHLVITGRAKDTIVLINGENIEPQPLEDICQQSPYINQIVVVGQDQKRLGALIYPAIESIQAWAQTEGLPEANSEADLVASPKVRELIQMELLQRIRNRPGYRPDDQISEFRLVPEPFTVENGLMTQTLKIRRALVTDRYHKLIQEIFASS